MASQANVYTSASSQAWYTDKARIATGTNAVTYQVTLAGGSDTIYSAATQVPANNVRDVYVGVGNSLTVTGGNVTITEVGTASSGTSAGS